jgi:hypothetical protein
MYLAIPNLLVIELEFFKNLIVRRSTAEGICMNTCYGNPAKKSA